MRNILSFRMFGRVGRRTIKDATGANSNVKQIYTLRTNMTVSDLVVVSDGNAKFRAIGEITGPYQFVPDYMGTYNHRRSVHWLWHGDESQPRRLGTGKEFIQAAAYQLRPSMIDWPAWSRIVAGGGEGGQTVGEPEAFVLHYRRDQSRQRVEGVWRTHLAD